MANTTTPNAPTIIVPKEQPDLMRKLAATQCAHGLALEINSGGQMKMSRRWNALKVTRENLGYTGPARNKAQALKYLVEEFQLTPTDSIVKALAKSGMEVVLVTQ